MGEKIGATADTSTDIRCGTVGSRRGESLVPSEVLRCQGESWAGPAGIGAACPGAHEKY
jgi:hypothetical protein